MLTGAARRRVFGEYQSSEPSRFIDEVPAELDRSPAAVVLVGERRQGNFRTTSSARTPMAAERRGEGRAAVPIRTRTRISRSAPSLRPGMRVRHAQFGTGTVISVEALNDDTKLVVRFAAVGSKRCARSSRGWKSPRRPLTGARTPLLNPAVVPAYQRKHQPARIDLPARRTADTCRNGHAFALIVPAVYPLVDFERIDDAVGSWVERRRREARHDGGVKHTRRLEKVGEQLFFGRQRRRRCSPWRIVRAGGDAS